VQEASAAVSHPYPPRAAVALLPDGAGLAGAAGRRAGRERAADVAWRRRVAAADGRLLRAAPAWRGADADPCRGDDRDVRGHSAAVAVLAPARRHCLPGDVPMNANATPFPAR